MFMFRQGLDRLRNKGSQLLTKAMFPNFSSAAAQNFMESNHPKTMLMNLCAKQKWPKPDFDIRQTGVQHCPGFQARVRVYVNGEPLEFESSSGHTRKAVAVHEATIAACKELQNRGLLHVEFSQPPPKAPTANGTIVQPDPECQIPFDEFPQLSRLKSKHPKNVLDQLENALRGTAMHFRPPIAHFKQLSDSTWYCRLLTMWSTIPQFEARATSKSKAELATLTKYCQQLKLAGFFDDWWRPIMMGKKGVDRVVRFPISPMPDGLRVEIDQFCKLATEFESDFEKIHIRAITEMPQVTENIDDVDDEAESELVDGALTTAPTANVPSLMIGERSGKPTKVDIITGKEFRQLDELSYFSRSHDLLNRLKRWQLSTRGADSGATGLPIAEKREEIVEQLRKSRAIIVAGGTGCGKTTQVPQFIFNDAVEQMEGAGCNILITQPRRISAISVGQRVALERSERVGDIVGYQVRLGARTPNGNGSMLFATPAIILRKLWDNPNFEGVSHVIIDEVHERDLWTDFLLIILRRALEANPKLKVILMSASMDSRKLSDYFGGCPIVTVDGRLFDVQEHFLEENCEAKWNDGMPATDITMVVDALSFVHENRDLDGSILCFLPSWSDISKVRQMFQDRHADKIKSFIIHTCHSRLPLEEQEKIFVRPPMGVRKIVLSTNITETSITINDIKYVINSGTRKNTSSEKNMRSIRQDWGSQSSQIQRRGRAGRVSNGECFHLFSKSTFDRMRQFDLPSMVKEPLENVILLCKLCCPKEDPQTLLEEALDRPPAAQLDNDIRLLTSMKLLDEERNLTILGSHVARLGCEPMLAVAMVYGAAFRCIEPIVTLTSIVQTDGLVQTMLEKTMDEGAGNAELEVKKRFVGNTASDHLAQVNVLTAYQNSGMGDRFAREYNLRYGSLTQSQALRRLFASELTEIGLCKGVEECLNHSSSFNTNVGHIELVKAVLAMGLHDQVVWTVKGVIRNGRLVENKTKLTDHSGRAYMVPNSSLFRAREMINVQQPNQMFVYIDKMLIGGSVISRVDGLTEINPITALLFSGHEPSTNGRGTVNLIGSQYLLEMDQSDAARLCELRKLIRKTVEWRLLIKDMKGDEWTVPKEKLRHLNTLMTPLLVKLLESFKSVG